MSINIVEELMLKSLFGRDAFRRVKLEHLQYQVKSLDVEIFKSHLIIASGKFRKLDLVVG